MANKTKIARNTGTHFGVVAAALIAFVVAGCNTFVPDEHHQDVKWDGGFGRATIGFVPYATPIGERFDGVGSGTGLYFEFPPAYPVVFVGSIAAAVAVTAPLWVLDAALDAEGELAGDAAVGLAGGIMEGASNAGILNSGISNPSSLLVSDISFDGSVLLTTHNDDQYGGSMDYTAVMLGLRVGGNRALVARPYLSGGWGWYWLDFTSSQREDVSTTGPYVGGGIEFMNGRNSAIALSARAQFYINEDNEVSILDGGMACTGIDFSFYW